jgi:hypothetical protein
MNYQAIYTEAVNLRFNGSTTKLAQVKNWVNLAEVEVWDAADWNFKRVPVTNLTVTSGVATVPADFSKGIQMYDSSGSPLIYLRPDDFEYAYKVGNPATGTLPYAWTVIDRNIYVGPSVSGTFKLAYRRRYTKRNSGGTPTQGVMSADTDTPYWDSEFHYVLVPAAIVIGMKLENDPTVNDMIPMRDEILARMMNELVGTVEKQVEFWGDPLPWYWR